MQIPYAKPLLVLIAALIAAFLLSLSIGYIQVHWEEWMGNLGGAGYSSPTEQEKLKLLESLKTSDTPSVAERSRVVQGLDTSTKETSEQEKLNILKSLHAKP